MYSTLQSYSNHEIWIQNEWITSYYIVYDIIGYWYRCNRWIIITDTKLYFISKYSFWVHDGRDLFDHTAIVSTFWYLYYKSSVRRWSYCVWLWTDRRHALATIVLVVLDKQKPHVYKQTWVIYTIRIVCQCAVERGRQQSYTSAAYTKMALYSKKYSPSKSFAEF